MVAVFQGETEPADLGVAIALPEQIRWWPVQHTAMLPRVNRPTLVALT